MKMALFIDGFPEKLLENMQRDIAKYADCLTQQHGKTVLVQCEADLVKCMEVIAIVDRYNFHMDEADYELESTFNAP